MREIHYRLRRRPTHGSPGAHRSRAPGPGLDVHALAPLAAYPDARRLDVVASAHDPFGNWMVRVPRQRTGVTLFVLADLSASMSFGSATRKQDALAELVDALGYSASRAGDAFALSGFGAPGADAMDAPRSRGRGAAVAAAQRLRAGALTGRGPPGLWEAALALPGRDLLVFVASDFHFGLDETAGALGALARHEVVPVVIWARDEFDAWPQRGLGEIEDLETGVRRTLLFRPGLARSVAERGRARRGDLRELFVRHGRRPFFLDGVFDPDALNAYFHGEDRA
ncbi:MAG TPA: MxaS protein [Burkholderiaceae bacterium]